MAKTAIFEYMFANDPDHLHPELATRSGSRVTITHEEPDQPGMNLYDIEFSDGYRNRCNDDELSQWKHIE